MKNIQTYDTTNVFINASAPELDALDDAFSHWSKEQSSVFDLADWSPEDYATAEKILDVKLPRPKGTNALSGYLEVTT